MFKRTLKIMSIIVLSMVIFSGQVVAADTATQGITFSIVEFRDITVSGNPGHMVLDTIVPNSGDYVPAVDTSTTFNLTSNSPTPMKITGELEGENMPLHTLLEVGLADVNGATNMGTIELDINPQTLLTGITHAVALDKTITYTLSGIFLADLQQNATSTVVFTFTDEI